MKIYLHVYLRHVHLLAHYLNWPAYTNIELVSSSMQISWVEMLATSAGSSWNMYH